jgi:aspartate racemase
VVVPADDERALVHRVIYEELCLGRVEASSRQAYARVVDGLVAAGARGIVLGCTEIGLLLRQEDASVPLFDTTTLHARGAVETALAAAIGEVRGRAPARS